MSSGAPPDAVEDGGGAAPPPEISESGGDGGVGKGAPIAGFASGSSNPSPAIVKKVKKVVEVRLDAPELTVALQQLNEFYGPNTLENRRNLRSSIQKRGVQVTSTFVDCFQDVMNKIDTLQTHVTQLSDCADRMQQRIKAAHATTSQVVKVTEQLQRKEEAAIAHKELVELLLSRFSLPPRDVQMLKEEPMSEELLVLLGRLATMQKESKELLRVHHKTALMDLVDSSAALQEVAFDRLYRWLQEQLSVMEGDSGDVPPLVRKGIRTLEGRPALFKLCLEELSARRKQLLHKRFLAALTRGGPGGTPKPIEMHAHDPIRYVGDMLAWAHQALASERDLVSSLLASSNPASPTASSADTAGQHDMVVSEVLGGLSATVEARLQGVLGAASSAVVLFKVGNLILFYLHTIGGLLPEGAPLTATLQTSHKLSGKRFMAALGLTASKLVKHPPPCPPSLAPHADVTAVLDELAEIMSSFDSSLIPARMRQAYFKPVVDEAVEPLIGGCALAANSVSAAEGPVYLVNCLLAIQAVLQRFEFCHWRLPQLQSQLTAALEQAVREQVVAVMRQCNLDEKMYTLRAFRSEGGGEGSEEKLSSQAGMDPIAVSVALKQFYGKVLTSSLDLTLLEKISATSLRHQALSLAAKGVATSYKELHDAILAPSGGYRDPQTLLLHSAQQIESLLVDAS